MRECGMPGSFIFAVRKALVHRGEGDLEWQSAREGIDAVVLRPRLERLCDSPLPLAAVVAPPLCVIEGSG